MVCRRIWYIVRDYTHTHHTCTYTLSEREGEKDGEVGIHRKIDKILWTISGYLQVHDIICLSHSALTVCLLFLRSCSFITTISGGFLLLAIENQVSSYCSCKLLSVYSQLKDFWITISIYNFWLRNMKK